MYDLQTNRPLKFLSAAWLFLHSAFLETSYAGKKFNAGCRLCLQRALYELLLAKARNSRYLAKFFCKKE